MSTSQDTGIPTSSDIARAGRAIWWMILLRGVFAILFGVLAIVFPNATLVALTILFAVYAIVDGVTEIVHAFRIRHRSKRWGWLLVQGIVSVLAGVAVAVFPALGAFFGGLFVIYMIAFWSLFLGFAGFPAAHAMADGGRKVWAYVTSVLSVLFGIALIVIATIDPVGAIQSLILVVGIYAIISGILLIALAFTARAGAAKVLGESV